MLPRQPVAYVGVRPELPGCRTWPELPRTIRRELLGVELARYGTVPTSQQDFQRRLLQVLSSLAGPMVMPAPRGHIGARIACEFCQETAARPPIVFLGNIGLVTLADCRSTSLPETERRQRRELGLVPPLAWRPGEALRASLRAVGVSRRRPWASA